MGKSVNLFVLIYFPICNICFIFRFVLFNQYKIHRDNLLNRTGDVTPDGQYVTPFKDPNKRFGN
jgi:hypothetical protein